MKTYLIGFFLMIASSFAYAQSGSPRYDLIQYLAPETHVTGVFVGVCDQNGNLATAWTYPRIRCLVVDTDEMNTYTRVKTEFPVGSKFESVFVYVTYIDPEAN